MQSTGKINNLPSNKMLLRLPRSLSLPAMLALALSGKQVKQAGAFVQLPITTTTTTFQSTPSRLQFQSQYYNPITTLSGLHNNGRIPTSESFSRSRRDDRPLIMASNENASDDGGSSVNVNDLFFDGRTTAALVGGQSLLIAASIGTAALVGTPNWGLGPGFALTWNAMATGILLTIPLGVLAIALDQIEDKFPALQDVTKATQRSVLSLLGGKFKPGIALITSLALGCVAGVGEEMLFRGVLQFELQSRFGQAIAVGLSSFIFGALHAVTPLYAFLAAIASVYFGGIYIWCSNLAVPIACHAFYDLVALLFAHYTVSKLDIEEQEALFKWRGPGDA